MAQQAGTAKGWRVVRRGTGLMLARFISKPKALAAALRFEADGTPCDITEEAVVCNQPSVTVPFHRLKR